MKKSTSYIIIIIVIAAGLAAYAYWKNPAQAPRDNTSGNQQAQPQAEQTSGSQPASGATSTGAGVGVGGSLNTITTPNPKGGQSVGTFSSGEDQGGEPDIQVVEVDFNGTSFTPASVNIKAGDYVIFTNKSSVNFWPASDPHPTHTDYPGFDAKKSIAPGGDYKFQFLKPGDWGYHDNLNPGITGTVNVSK